jgi:hypothetical protein
MALILVKRRIPLARAPSLSHCALRILVQRLSRTALVRIRSGMANHNPSPKLTTTDQYVRCNSCVAELVPARRRPNQVCRDAIYKADSTAPSI